MATSATTDMTIRSTMPWTAVGSLALLASRTLMALAQEPPVTPSVLPPPVVVPPMTPPPPPAPEPGPTTTSEWINICSLPTQRLVFTLADVSRQSCAQSGGDADGRCQSLCWCREWPTAVVTPDTLGVCVAANETHPCAGERRTDCREALKAATGTAVPSSSKAAADGSGKNTSAVTTDKDQPNKEHGSSEKSGGGRPGLYIFVGILISAIVAVAYFAVNWYRNRPRPISGPATVPTRETGLPTWTELDVFDKEMPPAATTTPLPTSGARSSRPGAPRSLHAVEKIDSNASMISGISGASYHDISGQHLGHVNEAHAITDTELSLSRDATERVFSPMSSTSGMQSAQSSFVSTDSADSEFHVDGRPVIPERYFSPVEEGQEDSAPQGDSTFVSVATTTYMTNNGTFTSELTIPESDDGASELESTMRSTTSRTTTTKEIEF